MTDSTMVVLGMTSFALVVVLYIWFALALAAMFRKMGEPAWKAWVPVLNVAMVLKRGDFSPWLVLLNVVPLFGGIAFVIVFIVAVHRITTVFGRGPGLTVVGALVPVVWASILGWGAARWPERSHTDRVDERSGPRSRHAAPAPASVPLVGGWTPDAAGAPDESSSERSRWSPEPASTPNADRGGWIPDAAPVPDTPIRSHPEAEPAPASRPIVMPFAAPSVPLSDVTPSPTDWSPPADAEPLSLLERRRGDDSRPDSSKTVSDRSVAEVIDALRSEPVRDADGPRRGRTSASSGDVERESSESEGTPGAGAAAATDPARVPERPVADDHDPADTGSEPPVAAWVSPASRTPTPDAERAAPIADVPLTRPSQTAAIARPSVVMPGEEFPELSEAVSAVAEAPEAGAPRSARTSVSSLYAHPAVPDARDAGDDDDVDALDRTVVTRRRRIPWMLVPPSGAPVALTSDVVILGRRPAPDAAHPDAQLVAIADETRTVSKTHARLQLRGETWFVTDLDSTNGVLFATLMGTEVEAPRGEEIEAGARFFLGDAEVRLSRSDT